MTDERVQSVSFCDEFLTVDLKDGRSISVPIEWYPRLAHATETQRSHWQICGGGYGIHWPDIDEDLSTEGLLRGAPTPVREHLTEQEYDFSAAKRGKFYRLNAKLKLPTAN